MWSPSSEQSELPLGLDGSHGDTSRFERRDRIGDGGAARLLGLCDIHEMPATIRDFLSKIYGRYPKPKKKLGGAGGAAAGEAGGAAAAE